MTARHRLPDRRAHTVVEFEHAGHRYRAGLGHHSDGRLAEIFLDCAKHGTAVDVSAKDSAVVASLALQHGVDVDTIRHALTRNSDGSASGPLGAVLDRLANE